MIKLNEIKERVKELKAKEEKVPELFKSTIDMFTTYEEQGMEEFSNGNRSKFVFYDIAPKKLLDSVKKFQTRYNSPYEHLDAKIHDDILDIDAMSEAWEKMNALKANRDKLIKAGQSGSAECQSLMEFIDLVTYVFSLEIEKFKKFFVDDYYRELNAIRHSCAINAKHMTELGTMVINNRNLINE